MDLNNYHDIIAMTSDKNEVEKVKLLLSEGSTSLTEVPDPYYGGEDGFEKVYKLIDQACSIIAKNLS
jgi:protein-tyrosine phosphatase